MSISNCKYILDQLTAQCGGNPNSIQEITIINAEDVVGHTASAAAGDYNVITSLTLAAGKKGFKFVDPRRILFTGSNKAGVTGTVRGTNTKVLQFLVLGNNPETTRAIDALANGTFVVALKTNDKSATSKGAVEIFGLYSACDGDTTPYAKAYAGDDENQGGYVVTLTCTESYVGVFMWDTDLATTLANYEALSA